MRTIRAITLAAMFLAPGAVSAQNDPSRGEVFQWLRQARGAALAGEKEKAKKLIDDARSWASKNKDKLASAWAEQMAGEIEFSAGDRAKATTAFSAALEAFTELKNDKGVANCRLNLGRLAFADNHLNDALRLQTAALEDFRKLALKAEEAAVLTDSAATLKALGNIARAKQALKEALAIYTDRPALDPAARLRVLADLGACSDATGEAADAIKHLNAAISLAVESKQASEEARIRNSLGSILHRQGNLEEARKHYETALKVREGTTGDAAGEATIRNNLGALMQDQGKSKEALDELNKALSLFAKQNDDAGQSRALYNIALVHEAEGRNSEAVAAYEKALALRTKTKDDAGTAKVLDNLSLLYAAAGQLDKAKASREEAERLRNKR